MKTIYLFIIILVFSMTSSYAFACGGGGGDGDSSSGSTAATNISSSSTLPPYQVSGNTTSHSSNIWDKIREQADKHRRDPGKASRDIQKLQSSLNKANAKTKAAQTNKNIEEIIHFLKMRALLSDDPNAQEILKRKIKHFGKKGVATIFVLGLLGGAPGFGPY